MSTKGIAKRLDYIFSKIVSYLSEDSSSEK